jgi:hypothetical protein
VSSAQASASVLRAADNTLVVTVDLYARGGHYRTAATCLAGPPVGLTGHDTTARASATVEGSIRIPVLDERTRALRLSSEDLPPAEARLEVTDPYNSVAMRIENRSGEQELNIDKRGVYLVRLSMHPRVEGGGGFREQRTRFSTRLRAERVSR